MTNPDTHSTLRPIGFRFEGQSSEFFRIWIVNLCLSILTLGIYSAWAKVRTHQYFYGHTTLDASSFEYTAKPLQILKGRLIAVGLFVLYQLLTSFVPLLALPILLAFGFLLPWIVIRSLQFSYFNTRYRNIRLGFTGAYTPALIAFVLLPVASLFTAGLLYPLAACQQQNWRVNNTRFGNTAFEVKLQVKSFYAIYLAALLLVISTLVIFFLINVALPHLAPYLIFLILPFYSLVYVYIKVKVTNLTFNQTTLGEHRFQSQMQVLPYLAIWLTNTLAILFTLGLATPWAMIRTARYRASCTAALVQGDLDHFMQAQQTQQNALGEELGEVLDLEFGI
ncbi:MAG: YjgN family protein [Pontibacterium sp.]